MHTRYRQKKRKNENRVDILLKNQKVLIKDFFGCINQRGGVINVYIKAKSKRTISHNLTTTNYFPLFIFHQPNAEFHTLKKGGSENFIDHFQIF